MVLLIDLSVNWHGHYRGYSNKKIGVAKAKATPTKGHYTQAASKRTISKPKGEDIQGMKSRI